MQTVTVKFKKLHPAAQVPKYQTLGAAGMDVHSVENLTVGRGETVMVPTGLSVEIPEGYEIQVRSRSGMASKGIFVTNSPGTIDSDYRGEVKILLTNLSTEEKAMRCKPKPFEIKVGDRIAQLVLAPVTRAVFEEVNELSPTARGDGGYGSTGA